MPSYLNRLGTVSRRGQWRFRELLRSRRADGRLDTSDAGLIDFQTITAAVLTVTPRARSAWGDCGFTLDQGAEPDPVLTASLANGLLRLLNPGIAEAVFPPGTLLAFPPGLYQVRIVVTIGPETAEIYDETVEFA